MMISEMTHVQFSEDILHCIKLVSILLNNIGLSLFNIVSDSPDVDGIDIAIYQPHLIDI